MQKSLGSKPTMAQLEAAIPHFRKLWKVIKTECHTTQGKPKYVSFTDEAYPVYGNDFDVAKRFVVDLATGTVLGNRYVSCGEGAINNGNASAAVTSVPPGHAVVDCIYSEYYRTFSMTFQVAPGTLVQDLPAGV